MHQAIFRLCAWCNIGVNVLWLYDPVDAWNPRGGTGCCEAAQNWTAALAHRVEPENRCEQRQKMMCSILRWRINRPRVQEFVKPLKQTLRALAPFPIPFRFFQSGVSERQVQHSVRYHVNVKGLLGTVRFLLEQELQLYDYVQTEFLELVLCYSKYSLLLMRNGCPCSVSGKVEVSTRWWHDAGYRM